MTQVFIHNWERSLKSQWYPRLQTWGRYSQQMSAAVWSWTKRAYAYLMMTKEDELRAWWRIQQEEKRIYWMRRGYADARHGTNGYPHHGSCYCAWCQAYWSGFFRYEHGVQQRIQLDAPNAGTSLGFLSPPPRREVLSRVAKALPLWSQADSPQGPSFKYLIGDHAAKQPYDVTNTVIAPLSNTANIEQSKQNRSIPQGPPRRQTQSRYSRCEAQEPDGPSRTDRKRTQGTAPHASPRQGKAAKPRPLGRASKSSQRAQTVGPDRA